MTNSSSNDDATIKEGDRCPECNRYNAMLHDFSKGVFICRDCGNESPNGNR